MTPTQITRVWPESTVVCIATGPSLTQADVDACRDRARVIVVNNAYQMAQWADALYACDGKWWLWHPDAAEFAGLKFFMSMRGVLPEQELWFRRLRMVENMGRDGLSLNPIGLANGNSSGYAAINLAVLLGARRVVLIGYDFQTGPKRRMHCHPDHPDKSGPDFLKCLDHFKTMVKPLQKANVEVVNCSRTTRLTCFPCQPLEDVLPARLEVAS